MMCRSLFVDLYKAMHENLGGIVLLGIDEYVMVLKVLLSYSLEIPDGHQIQESPNDKRIIQEKMIKQTSYEDFDQEDMSESDDSISV